MVKSMIYKLNNKEMRKKMREFSKTNYGKSIFLICYLPFIISFGVTIVFFFTSFCYFFVIPFLISLIFTILSFSIGGYGYYKEFRLFVNK